MRQTTPSPVFRRLRTHLVTATMLLLGSALVLALAVAPAVGQDQKARPGATDPMGKPSRYTLFPSHQLLVTQPEENITFTTFKSDSNLSQLTSISETSYSHTLAESADLKIAGSASVNDFGIGGEVRASADFEFHNSNSWGNVTTSSNTTNQTTDLTLNQQPAGNANQSYNYYPIFYVTTDGTVKVAQAVDNPASTPSSGNIFWSSFYGRGPDPALNLPGRFSTNGTDANGNQPWYATADLSRKAMRGFFLRKPDANPVTGDYDYLADTPLLGDRVRIDARIYNYSTAKEIDTPKVRFQVVEIDPDTEAEIDPNLGPRAYNVQVAPGNRTTIGETMLPLLSPLGTATVSIIWDTGKIPPPAFGDVPAGASQAYRIYVVLDPDNMIQNEIYETEAFDPTGANIDPGQNNEGFGGITISHPSVGGAPRSSPAASQRSNDCDPLIDPRCGNNATADAHLRADSLAGLEVVALGKSLPQLKTDRLAAYLNQPLRLRASVHSDQSHREFSHLLVYDGDPNQGGRLITGQFIHSGDAVNGTKVWFTWTPGTLGEHRLYARLLEKTDDKNPGNNVATLVVNVVPYDFIPPSLAVKLTPNVLHPADGHLVPITATLTVRDDQDAHPVIRLESITSSEASSPAPDVAGAAFGTDDRSFSLRAGQAAKAGPGRVYTVVYSATDASGNKTFATAYARAVR